LLDVVFMVVWAVVAVEKWSGKALERLEQLSKR